jgi:phytoene dehydrogenase-like protein
MRRPDAIVVGSGPNGLVAANLLLDAGWSVLVLEAQETLGGAVQSDSEVHPDYVHDTFSAFYPLAHGSPTIRGLGLDRHGLEWAHAPATFGTPFADGRWALQHADRNDTAAALDALCPGDGEAYLDLVRIWDRIGDQIVGALLSPFPPVKHGLGALARIPSAGGLSLVRTMLAPLRSMVDERFHGVEAKILFGGNAVHADIPMDAPGSGLMGLLLVMLGQTVGYPVPVGGAGRLTQALANRLTAQGGEIQLGTRVEEVLVKDRRATGVRTEDGDVVEAGLAVLADVSAPALYGGLVHPDHLPPRVLAKMSDFEWDPGTVKVDWAMNGPVPWASKPPVDPGTVHLAESIDEIAQAQLEIRNDAVPARPFLLIGQMAVADPGRAPAGGEALWAYTHVPHTTRSDAGDGGITGRWDRDDAERMADRMQARLEEFAPGFGDRVVARRVLGPRDMQDRDENLVNGALNGGTASLHQQLVFRPIPGLGRAETPIRGLFLASASAHPGGGVHGACGANAARAALAHQRVRSLVHGARRNG